MAAYVAGLVADPRVKAIVPEWRSPTTTDKWGGCLRQHAERLKTSQGQQVMTPPADKLIGRIRAERKGYFVVGFQDHV